LSVSISPFLQRLTSAHVLIEPWRADLILNFTLSSLTSPQVLKLYNRLLGKSVLSEKLSKQLSTLKLLTPGDFAILTRRKNLNRQAIKHRMLGSTNPRKQP